MNSPLKPAVAVASVLLLLPALLLSVAMLLGAVLPRENAFRMLEIGLLDPLGRILFSPVLVLGGVLGCLGLNVWQLCRLSTDYVHGTWLICLSVRRRLGHMILAGLGLALGLVWLTRAFVDHFAMATR